jgi:two-component system, NtrC family, sensor kinase
MATLGELSAGVAHELNNPAAAVTRAASFVTADLSRLLAAHPRGEVLSEVLNATRERSPLGTARQRELRRELAASLGSEQLARRLVSAGVDDPERTAALAADLAPERRSRSSSSLPSSAERSATCLLGTQRITDLVDSLKSYARPSDALIDDLDVATTIDDALQLVAHRLDGIELERRDAEDLPTIQGHPGPLGQVWTNLVLNAVDAMEGHGRLEVITRHEGGEVVVEVIDDGPGIAPEVLPGCSNPGSPPSTAGSATASVWVWPSANASSTATMAPSP